MRILLAPISLAATVIIAFGAGWTLMATVPVPLAKAQAPPTSLTQSCACSIQFKWFCGYDTFERCIGTRDPASCDTDCCDECYDEARQHCVAKTIECGWSPDDLTDCIVGARDAWNCYGCAGPPPPGCS